MSDITKTLTMSNQQSIREDPSCIDLDWVKVELFTGSYGKRHGRHQRRFARVSVQAVGRSLLPLWLLPDGVNIMAVVEFIRARCPVFVRCKTPALFQALGSRALREFADASREWQSRATELRLHQLAAAGWRLVHANATIGVVCLVPPDDPHVSAVEAISDAVSDCGVYLPQDAIEDITSGRGLDQHGCVYGEHGFDVSAGEALAVFCHQSQITNAKDDP